MTVGVNSLSTERGTVAETASQELLQEAALHALAAAAGCDLASPKPDVRGIDWTVTLTSKAHASIWDAQVDVQLKCTYQSVPNTVGDFPFKLDNKHFEQLATTHISKPRLLLVMLCPADVNKWVHTNSNWTVIRHSMYWLDLFGMTPTGKEKSVVRVPYANRLDALELCRILHIVGNGAKPWTF